MSDFSSKLSQLHDQEKQLIQKKQKLFETRKVEIIEYLEKFNLLTVHDAVLVGAFSTIETAVKTNDSCVKDWEAAGGKRLNFSKAKKENRAGAKKTQRIASTNN